MLVVAINHMGTIDMGSFASMFDFKVIELNPCEDSKEEWLQVCQPKKDMDLLKDIQQNSDPSELILKVKKAIISVIKKQTKQEVKSLVFWQHYRKQLLS